MVPRFLSTCDTRSVPKAFLGEADSPETAEEFERWLDCLIKLSAKLPLVSIKEWIESIAPEVNAQKERQRESDARREGLAQEKQELAEEKSELNEELKTRRLRGRMTRFAHIIDMVDKHGSGTGAVDGNAVAQETSPHPVEAPRGRGSGLQVDGESDCESDSDPDEDSSAQRETEIEMARSSGHDLESDEDEKELERAILLSLTREQ